MRAHAEGSTAPAMDQGVRKHFIHGDDEVVHPLGRQAGEECCSAQGAPSAGKTPPHGRLQQDSTRLPSVIPGPVGPLRSSVVRGCIRAAHLARDTSSPDTSNIFCPREGVSIVVRFAQNHGARWFVQPPADTLDERRREGDHLDAADRFSQAIAELDAISDEFSPEEARSAFDETTLQVFWREWTRISQWAGALWRSLSEDLEAPATPVTEPEDEVGGPG